MNIIYSHLRLSHGTRSLDRLKGEIILRCCNSNFPGDRFKPVIRWVNTKDLENPDFWELTNWRIIGCSVRQEKKVSVDSTLKEKDVSRKVLSHGVKYYFAEGTIQYPKLIKTIKAGLNIKV